MVRVGSKEFLEQEQFNLILQKHAAQLDGLKKVLDHAPYARDAGSAVERVLRLCTSARLVHFERNFPPSFSVPLLQQCHQKTLNFVVQHLYAWKDASFWNEMHKKLALWNLELQIAEGGAGLVPQWKLADACCCKIE